MYLVSKPTATTVHAILVLWERAVRLNNKKDRKALVNNCLVWLFSTTPIDMAILDKSLQNKIDDLSNQAYEKFQNGETDASFSLLLDAWHLYPEPKSQWNESYNTGKYIFQDYIRVGDFEHAKLWLNRMIDHNNERHLFDYDVTFNVGKYYFETGDYQTAYQKWQYVVSEAGLRYFEEEKKDYLDFYLQQDNM